MNVKYICIGSGFREVAEHMRMGDPYSLPNYTKAFRELKVSAKYDDTIAAEVPMLRVRNYLVHEVRGVPQGTPWPRLSGVLRRYRKEHGKRMPLIFDFGRDAAKYFGKGRN